MSGTHNLTAALLDELERVVAVRERWRIAVRQFGFPGAAQPLQRDIEAVTSMVNETKTALAMDDGVACVRLYAALKAVPGG